MCLYLYHIHVLLGTELTDRTVFRLLPSPRVLGRRGLASGSSPLERPSACASIHRIGSGRLPLGPRGHASRAEPTRSQPTLATSATRTETAAEQTAHERPLTHDGGGMQAPSAI